MTNKLRVIHVSTPLSWRGGEQQVAYLMQGLQSYPDVAQMLICPEGSVLADHAAERGYDTAHFSRTFSLDPRIAWKFGQIQKKWKADVWHLHDPHAHTLAILATALGWLDVPLVLHRRVDYAVKQKWSSLYKYRHLAIKRIICVSEEVKHVLLPTLTRKEHVQVIHSGIDLSRFKGVEAVNLRAEFGVEDGLWLIGHVGALSQQKDFFTFLRTAAELGSDFPAHFFIIGEGEQKEELKAEAERLKLMDRVTFTGFRTDIPAVMRALDLLLFTSEKEGLGTTLLDAQAAGLPIVATNAGGIPEIVQDGETGLLAGVREVEALAGQVRRMYEEKALRNELAQNAFRSVNTFAFGRMVEGVMGVYREIILKK